ncbi:MAG: ABC transporter substrate-binding protein, partial [Desulfobacterales bacterium]|nr:ABC transporter substrate-binding protein [Desulfobacterales bacterium]
VRAYEQAALKENIDVSMINWHSSVAIALMNVVSKNRIPHYFGIGAAGTINEKYHSDPKRYSYWIGKGWPEPTKTTVGYAQMIEDAMAKGVFVPRNKKFVVFGEDTDWGRSVGKGYKKVMEDIGWECVSEDYFRPDETDFYPLMTSYKKKNVSVMIGTNSVPPSVAAFVKQKAEVGVPALLFCEAMADSGEWYDLMGPASNGAIEGRATWVTPKHKAFASKFKSIYGFEPSAAAGGQVYDYSRFFIKCLKAALKEYGSLNRKTLYKFGQEFVMTGKIVSDSGIVHDSLSYTPNNYPDPEFGPGKWMFPIVQYFNGHPNVVWPPSQKTGELIVPDNAL